MTFPSKRWGICGKKTENFERKVGEIQIKKEDLQGKVIEMDNTVS